MLFRSVSQAGAFDALVLAHDLSGIDGLSLAKKLRNDPETAAIPIVLLTAKADASADKPNADTAEAVVYLEKPVQQSSLYNTLIQEILTSQNLVSESGHSQTPPNHQKRLAERYPLKILAAEDNLVNQQLVYQWLNKLGYRADFASNGIEVLEALDRQPYDVVLMDVQMPEMDGLTATQRICKQ